MSVYMGSVKVSPLIEAGGSAGHTVYFINRISTNDNGTVKINDGEGFNPVNDQGGSGTSSSNCVIYNVESIYLGNFDHWSMSSSSSDSWACWRPHQNDWQSWNGSGGTFISGGKTEATFNVTQDIDFVIHSGTCLTGDMLILMADGSEKAVRNVKVGDMVMTPEGPEKVTWSDSDTEQYGDVVDHWYFGDLEIKTINPHRFYNVEKKDFVYLHHWRLGEHTVNDKGEEVMLTGHLKTLDRRRHYTIFVDGCNAYYVNGLLSGNRFSKVKI